MLTSPLISIITVVFNGENLIEKTIRNILGQTYTNIECLVIDGKSRDKTLEKLQNIKDNRLRIFSEPDRGIYDAMNKGIAHATGDYIIFINAGDAFFEEDTLTKMMRLSNGADVLYGNTMVMDTDGKLLGERRLTPPKKLDWRSLRYGMCVSHQSFMVKKSCALDYDLTYKISADIDWMIRVLKGTNSIVNTHLYISRFLVGGVSSSRRKQTLTERFSIMVKHYGWFQTLWSHLYITVRFVKHYFTKKNMT